VRSAAPPPGSAMRSPLSTTPLSVML
jgi:hypothetical protein